MNLRRCPCNDPRLEACILWAGHPRRCRGLALPGPYSPEVLWPGLVVQRNAQAVGLQEMFMNSVVALLAWNLLPRTGLTGWPHHAMLAASIAVLIFAWRGLAIFSASSDWLALQEARHRHAARLSRLRPQSRSPPT